MDALDTYLIARCLLLADALERFDELPDVERAWVLEAVVGLLDLLADALGAERPEGADRRRCCPIDAPTMGPAMWVAFWWRPALSRLGPRGLATWLGRAKGAGDVGGS